MKYRCSVYDVNIKLGEVTRETEHCVDTLPDYIMTVRLSSANNAETVNYKNCYTGATMEEMKYIR